MPEKFRDLFVFKTEFCDKDISRTDDGINPKIKT